jgi:hypothetical protein
LFEFGFGHHLAAPGTFGPQSFRHIAFAARADFQRRLLENSHVPFLSAGDRDDNHGGGPGFPQDPGTGVGRGAGGKDIVNESDHFPPDPGTMAEREGALQIPEAFFAVKMGLGESIARPAEAVFHGQPQPGSGQDREDLGLVEFAFASARRVERHWHDSVRRPIGQPRIAESLGHHTGKQVAQVQLAVVFKLMNEVANHAAAAVGRGGEIEAEFEVAAIHAAERRRYRSAIRLAANRTARTP